MMLPSSKDGKSMKDLFSSFKSGASLSKRSSSFLRRSNASDTAEDGAPTSRALPLPLPDVKHPFPVVEQPSRIILTSLDSPHFDERRLTSGRRGEVSVTSNRGDSEQFLLIPVIEENRTEMQNGENKDPFTSETCQSNKQKRDVFYLRSYKFNRYLSADSVTGVVSTVDVTKLEENSNTFSNGDQLQSSNETENAEQQQKMKQSNLKSQLGESEKWLLMCSPHGGHFIISAQNERNIACIKGGESLKIGLGNKNDISESWEVEFVSGELCFLSSIPSMQSPSSVEAEEGEPQAQKQLQIRCDLMGRLTLTADKRGWEVWRFVETGGGKVRIVSWMHSNFCVACDHDGKVSTACVGKAGEGCDEWTVEKAPGNYQGVVIRSVACARRILSRSDENGFMTTLELEGQNGVWQLDAAHSQTYTLSSVRHNRSIGPFPYVTENLKQSDQLILQQVDEEGTVRLFHKSTGQYLKSSVDGKVTFIMDSISSDDGMEDASESSELWKMEQRIDLGGYTFSSTSHDRLLAFSDDKVNPKLCTVAPSETNDNREVWSVNPILPRAISSSKIKTFALGTSIAVGTTVAMPFLMAGMLAVVPAEATLAASILSVGLTSAEAIASVGAIGATAAIVFREAGDTLGIESEHDDDGSGGKYGGNYTKRPLCAWRSW